MTEVTNAALDRAVAGATGGRAVEKRTD